MILKGFEEITLMLNKRKVCVFTVARSDYFLLRPLLDKMKSNELFELQIVAAGMHMCKEFGETWKMIEEDGFVINEKISMIVSGDNHKDTLSSMALGMIKISDILSRLSPDICVILGDRFEMMSFAIACYILGIPTAHIHGGELTFGAFDDGMRHCITKMSSLHFPATEEYRKRIIQMGEYPSHVFNVGALAVENIKYSSYKDVKSLESLLNCKLGDQYFLVTLHPETRGSSDVEKQVEVILDALKNFPKYTTIWTCSNADPAGRALNKYIQSKNQIQGVFPVSNLGDLYLSVLKNASAVIGNSSSAIIEAPILGIPTVNIGSRQEGRIRTPTIIDCHFDVNAITKAIENALSMDFISACKKSEHPYGIGISSEKIISALLNFDIQQKHEKKFYDICFGENYV